MILGFLDCSLETDALFYQFLDIVEAFNSPEQVFDMIISFVNGCTDSSEMSQRSSVNYAKCYSSPPVRLR